MTPLEEQLARAKRLGFDEVQFGCRDGGDNRAVYYAMDGAMLLFVPAGMDSVSALSGACDSYERSTMLEPENKRDRQTRERPAGPSSTTSVREA